VVTAAIVPVAAGLVALTAVTMLERQVIRPAVRRAGTPE